MARTAPSARPLTGNEPVAAPEARWILYVDLDAYYVACELRDRPELRGRPVIVGPPPTAGGGRGVVLSASYEARAFGVRSAQPIRMAARQCPEAVWIPPDFPKYERVAHEVRELLKGHSSHVVPYSIDEAALVLEGISGEAAEDRARAIQSDLRDRLGLGASIGVATSRTVAKIACDQGKPGGVVRVDPGAVAAFVGPLPVRTVPGVGPRTEEVLAGHGVRSVADLVDHDASEFRRDLGGFGKALIELARGHPREEPDEADGPRSRSSDHTFAEDCDRWEEILPVVRTLSHDLATSLEREGLRYASVAVAFRWADFERSQRGRSMVAAYEGPAPLVDEAVRLARNLFAIEQAGRRRAVRTVSVRAERLTERGQRQAQLDDFPRAKPGRRR